MQPETVISALESNMFGERNEQVNQQLVFLECELDRKQAEDDKLYRAYVAEVFDEMEYRERRKELKDEVERLQKEAEHLRLRQITREQFEAQKAQLIAMSENLRSTGALVDPPFEMKRRILKMTVDAIHVNQREGWFTITGSINPSTLSSRSPP